MNRVEELEARDITFLVIENDELKITIGFHDKRVMGNANIYYRNGKMTAVVETKEVKE